MSKAISDLPIHDLAELIEETINKYYSNDDKDERKKLKNEYIELAKHYNESSGVKVYKMTL